MTKGSHAAPRSLLGTERLPLGISVDTARGGGNTRAVNSSGSRDQRDKEHCEKRDDDKKKHTRCLKHFHRASSSQKSSGAIRASKPFPSLAVYLR